MDPFRLDGKRALITGGGTGLGLGIARAFIERGAKVIITGRREDVIAKTSQELGDSATFMAFDIDNQKEIPNIVNKIESEFGPIDILVNNAGRHHKAFANDTTDVDFLKVLQTNLLSVFSLTRECAKHMLKRKRGSIILISSMAAGVAIDRVVAYSTSKTGLLGMMRTMAVEYAHFNVRINAIAPGWIKSDMLDAALENDPQRKTKVLARIPNGQFGDPKDIGYAAVFLASDASVYISNAFIPVDGAAFQAL